MRINFKNRKTPHAKPLIPSEGPEVTGEGLLPWVGLALGPGFTAVIFGPGSGDGSVGEESAVGSGELRDVHTRS